MNFPFDHYLDFGAEAADDGSEFRGSTTIILTQTNTAFATHKAPGSWRVQWFPGVNRLFCVSLVLPYFEACAFFDSIQGMYLETYQRNEHNTNSA